VSASPTVVSGFRAIYAPGEDFFPGPDSENVKTGDPCKRRIANDRMVSIIGDSASIHRYRMPNHSRSVM